jgi:coenzyme F420-0:L-glutamate ligase
MHVHALHTRLFIEGENLEKFIIEHVPTLKDKDILVVTSKIVALAENRTVIATDQKSKESLIIKESEWAMPTKYIWISIKDGMIMAAAGIDESNAAGKLILLPKDSFAAAARLRTALRKHYRIKKLGVILTDSRVLPLRAGVVGVAVGYAGFRGVKDYRGTADLFGRKMRMTKVDIADSLATAAVLLMGEGKERRPLAIVSDAAVEFCERVSRHELAIAPEDDLYAPLFKHLRIKPKRV